MKKVVGLTKDASWQVGVRHTFAVSTEQAWEFLFSDKGVETWLGDIATKWSPGTTYVTDSGTSGKVKVLKHLSHIRMTYKKNDWENESLLQIRVLAAKTGTTISFHQEKLKDAVQREEMREYWEAVLQKINNLL